MDLSTSELEAFFSKLSAWMLPFAIGIATWFLHRFVRNVDREIEKLRSAVGKAAIDISEKSMDIKMSIVKIEEALKGTVERVTNLIKKTSEHEKTLSTHQNLHVTTKEILKSQRDQIKSIVERHKNKTIVREKKK